MKQHPNKEQDHLILSAANSATAKSWGAENAPFTPQLYLLVLMTMGSVMAFVATPCMYIAYAVTQRELYQSRSSPLPIVTNMFCDWPLASSCVTGLGLTLLFTGMAATAVARIPLDIRFKPRTRIMELAILGQVGVWILLPTSVPTRGEGQEYIWWMHYGATFLLMASSVYALYQAANVCVFFSEVLDRKDWHMQGLAKAAVYLVYVAVVGIVATLVSGGYLAVAHSPADHPMRLVLALGELTVLGFAGAGYFMIIYVYAGIEDAAAKRLK